MSLPVIGFVLSIPRCRWSSVMAVVIA